MPVSGPPLTWDYKNGDSVRTNDSGGSNSTQINGRRGHSSGSDNTSMASSITAKGDQLPPIPGEGKFDREATVRHGLPGEKGSKSATGQRRETPDDYDDYDDRHPDHPGVEDDLADTTMLDSVVLPAIASVCLLTILRACSVRSLTCVTSALPSCQYSGSSCRIKHPPTRLHRSRTDYTRRNDGARQRDRRLR